MSSFLKELSEQTHTSVIMISRDLDIAAKYADKLLVLEPPGRMYDIGEPKEIINRDMVRHVYKVDCDIVDDKGTPHVILQDAIF